jgi:hypothetical protein
MNRTKIIILVCAGLAVLAAGLLLTRSRGTFDESDKDFAVDDTSTITKVFLADKNNNTVLLERVGAGEWRVNGRYKARKSGIDMLLFTLSNITPRAPVPKKGHNSVIRQLASASTKVEIYQQVYRIRLFNRIRMLRHEKLSKTYYVGEATQNNMGNFMLMEGSEIPFVVHILNFRGFLTPRYSVFEEDWRDHTIFNTKMSDIRSVTVEFPDDSLSSYRIENGRDDIRLIQLVTGKEAGGIDTLRVLNFLAAFKEINYEALLNDLDSSFIDSVTRSRPYHIITLADSKGKVTQIKTFHKKNDAGSLDLEGNLYVYDLDRLYGLIDDGKDFILIQYFVFEKILRPLGYFTGQQPMSVAGKAPR